MTDRLTEIEARLEAATPGPWEYGDRYSVCGVMPKMFGEGKCSSCRGHGEPDWVGRLDINGTRMLAHVHIMDKPWLRTGIVHYDGNGNLYSVVIETDEYGLMDAADAALIASAPADLRYLLERVRAWRELAEEAITEFDDARGYAGEYFSQKWRYDATSALFAERRAALTEGESE